MTFADKLIWAFTMTMELWLFLGLMGFYLVVESMLGGPDAD